MYFHESLPCIILFKNTGFFRIEVYGLIGVGAQSATCILCYVCLVCIACACVNMPLYVVAVYYEMLG